jgi:alpha-tubulin suppressor-like RCC1 family protein
MLTSARTKTSIHPFISCVSFFVFFLTLLGSTIASALTAQTITGFTPTTPITYTTGRTFTLTATGGASGNPVVFASTTATATVCTVSGKIVTVLKVGTCTLTANQAGNATFSAAAQVTKSVVISIGSQTITIGAITNTALGTSLTLTGISATSGLTVLMTSSTTSACTISGFAVTLRATGTCTLLANQAGNTNFSAAPQVSQSFTILAAPVKTNQTITFGAIANTALGTSLTLTGISATSGLTVLMTSSTISTCTILGFTVTLVTTGTCTLLANQAGNASFNAAPQVSRSFTVLAAPVKTNQTITFAAIPNTALGTPLTLTGITATSGLTVAMTSATTNICTILNFTVTLLTTGTCTLLANQAGNASFNAAPQVSQSFTVLANSKTNQTITFSAIPNDSIYYGGTSLGSVFATSGLAVVMTSGTTTVCTIAVDPMGSFYITYLTPGTCTIRANQAGNATFNAAPQVSRSFTVSAIPNTQTIAFGAIASQTLGSPLVLNVTASSSLAVQLTSSTPAVCTVSATGFNVTLWAVGTCTLNANQPGDISYNPAPQITQSFTVLLNNTVAQTVSYGALQVAAGTLESCAITELGGVKCWRGNLKAVDIVGLSGVTALAVGSQSCALMTSGGVKCWGSTRIPVDVAGLTSGIAAIAVGGGHACALTISGGVKCWGNNASRQLGNNSTVQSNTPVDVIGLTSGVAAISTGDNFTCAVTTGGGAKCWGDNTYGQLGDNSILPRSSAVDVFELTSGVKAIAAGGRHACAITAGGASVLCWGSNDKYQLGNLALSPSLLLGKPLSISGVSSFVSVVAGATHTCGLDFFGGVECWGDGGYGQLGDGAFTFGAPGYVKDLRSGVAQISAGGNDSCALTAGGEVKCWGANEAGPYLVAYNVNGIYNQSRRSPVGVSGLSNSIRAVSAGGAHTCALGIGDDIKCWGNNASGQLGDGTNITRQFPVIVNTLSLGNASSVTVGGEHSCALSRQFATSSASTLLTNSSISCWGANANGQLTNGNTFQRTLPDTALGQLSNSGVMSAGARHTCSVGDAGLIGVVRCAGANAQGRLGDNTTIDRSTAVDVVGLGQSSLAVSTGNQHTCAISYDRLVRCWGANASGQLGDGTTTQHNAPVVVSGVTADAIAVSVVSGGEHNCILTYDGLVKCWGRNAEGQLGDGTTTQRNAAVNVSDMGAVISAIATGNSHTCALTTSGGVKCWGLNTSGQLGDNTTIQRNAPFDVVGLSSNVVSISAGGNHTCAAIIDGSVKCWGRNLEGQLGDNTFTNRLTPTLVFGIGSRSVLTTSANPVTINKNVTYTMTVAGITPTGTVAFKANNALIVGCEAVPLVGSAASCTTSFATLNYRTIMALYSGDTLNSRSVAALPGVQYFVLPKFNVTSSAASGGIILPSGVTAVTQGNTLSFAINGYKKIVDTVTGTCGGTLKLGTAFGENGIFTTNPITADCTVIASVKPQLTQTVTFTLPATAVVGQTYLLNAAASSGLSVTYKSGTLNTCIIIGNTFKPVSPGLCSIVATQSNDYTFAEAYSSQYVTIVPMRPYDISGDTKSDLLLQATDGTVAAWIMNGTSVLSTANLRSADPNWTITHVADFNGDGKADILWRHVDGTVAMWLMNGTTVLSTATLRTVEPNWTVTHTGDFNGDGMADILWRHTDGTTTAWLMNGTTTSSSTVLRGTAPNWRVSHVGKFDTFGSTSVVWRNDDGSVSIWNMNGGVFTPSYELQGADPNWRVSHVVYFSDNGRADILWRHNDGSVKISFFGCGGVCYTTDISGPDANWRVSHVADFNGDGKADLLWRHTDGSIKIWLMDNGALTSAINVAGIPANSRVNHTPDLNGDGKADLIWRKDDGTITAWLMDGAVATATAQLASPNAYRVLPLPEAEFSSPVILPSVSLTAPLTNTTVGSPVTLTVNAQYIPGTITTIEFLDGAKQIIGYNINTASINYTLSFDWDSATSGSHTITVKLVNSAGVTYTSAPVTVQVRAAPTVSLSAAGAFYVAPANVEVLAAAAAVEPGSVLSRVEIYSSVTVGSNTVKTLVTAITAPPFRYRFTNLALGNYTITARAFDSYGSTRESAPFVIRVGNTTSLVPPSGLNGSTINSNTLSFAGTINAPPNSSVTINGVPVTISREGAFIVNGLVLNPGVNTLTIVATPPSGPVLTQTVTVTRAASPLSFEIDVSPIQGIAPVISLLKVKNPGGTPFTTLFLSCDNPSGNVANAESEGTSIAGALECAYTKPGLYQPWAAIKDAQGTVIWSSTKYVVVNDPFDTYAIIRSVYFDLEQQLKAGNASSAANLFSEASRTAFTSFFSSLGSNLSSVGTQLGQVQGLTLTDNHAELIVVRTTASGPTAFPIHVTRDPDGVWRIESM